jgi:hypothetical protein
MSLKLVELTLLCVIAVICLSLSGVRGLSLMTFYILGAFTAGRIIYRLSENKLNLRRDWKLRRLNSLVRRSKRLDRRCKKLAAKAAMNDNLKRTERQLYRYMKKAQARTLVNDRWQKTVWELANEYESLENKLHKDRFG